MSPQPSASLGVARRMFDAASGGIDGASFSEGPAASFQRPPREVAIDYLAPMAPLKAHNSCHRCLDAS
jgi:hypothetical protein